MLERPIRTRIEEALTDMPVTMVIGPRQSGKSTLAKTLPGRTYVTFDDPATLSAAASDPGAFLDGFSGPVTIDEVQRLPEILLPIKLRVDRNREAGRYVLTGSANVLTLPKVADSLAGRMEIIDLLPLTQAEIEGTRHNFLDWAFAEADPEGETLAPYDLIARVSRGGFPQPATTATESRREAWASSYIRTLLERDVRDLAAIESARLMPRLLALLASRNGGTMNVDSLSRDAAIPATSVRRYTELLSKLFLIQSVPAWSMNLGARLIKAPKAYLADSLLTMRLQELDIDALRRDRNRMGPILEGFVANELARLATWSRRPTSLFHFRTVRGKEVDFVLQRGNRQVAIEVKAAESLRGEDYAGLEYFESFAPESFIRGIVLYGGTEVRPLRKGIYAVPFASLWSGG